MQFVIPNRNEMKDNYTQTEINAAGDEQLEC